MASAASKNVPTARIKANELFALWISSAGGESTVDTLVAEMLAAAQVAHVDPLESVSVPGLPATPPRHAVPRSSGHGDSADCAQQPPSLSPRFLGVDEIEMHRAMSPGASSPVSPNSSFVQGHRVDPHLPRSPDASSVPMVSRITGITPGAPIERQSSDRMSLSGTFGRAPSPGIPTVPPKNHATYDDIPLFYRPKGPTVAGVAAVEESEALHNTFSRHPGRQFNRRNNNAVEIDTSKTMRRTQIGPLCTDVFRLPAWLRSLVFQKILQANSLPDNGPSTVVRFSDVKKYYDGQLRQLSPNRRLFELLSTDPKKHMLSLNDLISAARLLVEFHQGLSFLSQPEFQELYCRTVAIRIIYLHEREHRRLISWPEFDRSDVGEVMRSLDQVTDINQVLQYFSYEHFYVLYCRFWELDTNKDHKVGLADLQKYSQGQLTTRVLDRVVRGFGRKLSSDSIQELDFEDFVYFCLSEEDKNTTAAKKYWFGVLDLDGDGILSGHELEYFFEEQSTQLAQLAGEEIPYQDMLCQMLDMICPQLPIKQGIRLSDLRRCETTEHFFNMIFNATKFLQFEHRDPFAEHQLRQLPEKTQWDRFARAEYDRMAQEATQ